MQHMVKPGFILCLITLIAALLLGLVYNITKEPIQQQKEEMTANAMKKLLPTADSFDPLKMNGSLTEENPSLKQITKGLKQNEIIGYIVNVSTKGYSGDIDMLVAINMEGGIEGVEVVSQTETPGLGANAQKPSFIDQYKGMSGVISVTKSPSVGKNEIQAMTSATITSKAVTLGVNDALKFFEENLRQFK